MGRAIGRRQRQRAAGFVLPLTIWILAAVAVVAAFLAERVQRSLQLAQQRMQTTAAQVELGNAQAELLFRLTTQPMSQCGSGDGPQCLALDNRPYREGNTELRLQDVRGLFSLNLFGDDQMDRLLQGYGLPSETRARLSDALRDYIDADDLRRLNGAESPDYARQGLPPPRNAPLVTPMEVRAVLGWRAAAALWSPPAGLLPLDELSSVSRFQGLNPNTASAQVLQVLPGVTPERAQAIIERRRLGPVDIGWVDRLVGGGLSEPPSPILAFPAPEVRVTQSAAGLPWALRYTVRLTPRDPQAPWRITYFHRLESHLESARTVAGYTQGEGKDVAQTLPPRGAPLAAGAAASAALLP